MQGDLGILSLPKGFRLRWRIFDIWTPRWRLGESDSSLSKSQHRLPDLLHLPVHAQQRNYKSVWW